jgi:hypothetical protein
MTTGRFEWAAARGPTVAGDAHAPKLAVGDRIRGPSYGIIVDMDTDSVVVARRSETGRCMEVVFVGAAAKTLRRDS